MTLADRRLALALLVVMSGGGCRSETPQAPAPTSDHVELREPAGDPWSLRLSPDAYARLGIETDTVKTTTAARTRVVGGVVVVPVGGVASLAAPLAAVVHAGDVPLEPGMKVEAGALLLRLVPLAPVDRDLRAQARRARASTQAQLELMRARVARTRELLDNKASSARALEEAIAQMQIAEGDDQAARARERALSRTPLDADVSIALVAPRAGVIRSITAEPGQVVAAGTALVEIIDDARWLRVPVYAGDVDAIAATRAVRVARLGHELDDVWATPVLAPPSADPLATTIDYFYALDIDTAFVPGERVLVELGYTSDTASNTAITSVPASALIVDAGGGTWVYECVPEHGFVRRRVDVLRRVGDELLLRRGPAPGTCIVRVGALELFGAEFGVSH